VTDDGEAGADDDLDADELADDALEEIRQAAGAVVASLKWLVEATERVVDKPEAFSQAVDSGKSVVEAFLGGFADQSSPASENTEGDDFVAKS
jgi:hypothetical protein